MSHEGRSVRTKRIDMSARILAERFLGGGGQAEASFHLGVNGFLEGSGGQLTTPCQSTSEKLGRPRSVPLLGREPHRACVSTSPLILQGRHCPAYRAQAVPLGQWMHTLEKGRA